MGWLGVLGGLGYPAHLVWLANPLLIFTWALIGSKSSKAGPVSLMCLGFAASFVMADRILIGASHTGAIQVSFRIDLRYGYWLWLASIACAVVAAQLTRAPATLTAPIPASRV
jgi:hypothetical protein